MQRKAILHTKDMRRYPLESFHNFCIASSHISAAYLDNYPQTRYLPLVKANLTELKASEKETIDRVIEQMSDWSASSISNYSHKDLPWLVSKEGNDINYELAFYREAPYSVRNYGNEIEEQ